MRGPRDFRCSIVIWLLASVLPVTGQLSMILADEPAEVAERAQALREQAERHFTLTVLPLLKAKCVACHGEQPTDLQGGLDVTSRPSLLKGGESGEAAIVPGRPQESLLLSAIRWDGLEMPPKQNDRLAAAQIEAIRRWIADGAVWPDEVAQKRYLAEQRAQPDAADGILVGTRGGLSDPWTERRYAVEQLWAYQPLWKPESGWLPALGRGPIDALIDQRLRTLDLQPAPAADRRTLIRRVTFDLLGLPPTPEEVAAFVADPDDDALAWSRLVERLLQSPHYGEQWGRHWLDVVRYADSSGYANDYERGSAWRYRDYVVRSFNDDKPYDQFVREQIAGDEIDPGNPELLIAVGFLRMGPWELTGMEVAKVARQRFLDDVTDIVGQVFLGQMLQCARCHDHKFDPIPTRDYYAMQAAFATTQLVEREAAFLPSENTAGFDEKKYPRQREDFYRQILDQLERKSIDAARQWYADQGADASQFERLLNVDPGGAARQGRPLGYEAVRRALMQQGVAEDQVPPRHAGFTPQDYGRERVARKGLERLQWTLERYAPTAISVYSGRTPALKSVSAPQRLPEDRLTVGELEPTCILAGGDPFSPTDAVSPGTLSAVANWADPALTSLRIPDTIEGRRLALAHWIASPHNPLTARVMVNRIWQWHFGQPLAGNPNNFGATGKKPTHPQLLDWLAGQFIESGWSVKSLHRLILNSDAYRRGNRPPDPKQLADRDVDQTSYAVFRTRRLDAEELRDATLRVSGELNPVLGGIPVRPEMDLDAALQTRMVMGTFAEAWQPSPLPAQRHRRSLYALRIRGQRDPFFEVFNAPNPDVSCEAREASTVTPQVFAQFNSPQSFARALAFATRLLKTSDDREATLHLAIRLAYGRPAVPQEIQLCLQHWEKMTLRHRQLQFQSPSYPRHVVRQAVEENTGERFTFVEPLEVYADFVPDLSPADVGPEVRGLAEVCLILLNANEFVYVH